MEQKAEYHTQEPDPECVPVVCQHCGDMVGRVVAVNGKYYIRVMGTDLYSFHGWHNCQDGSRVQVHWDSGEVRLRRLLKNRKVIDTLLK